MQHTEASRNRTIIISIDDSKASTKALEWGLGQVVKSHDQVHLITVMPPMAYAVYPTAPVATAAALSAVTHQWEAQKKHNEAEATQLLKRAADIAQEYYGVKAAQIHALALPAAGGASGVAESVVEYSNAKGCDLVVVGSRGLGSFKRSLMGLVGLGSVSDYLVHNLHCPVAVVHYDEQTEQVQTHYTSQDPRKVCVACDDSDHSESALAWAMDNLVRTHDQLHVVSVTLPVSLPVMTDEVAVAAVTVMESQQYEEMKAASRELSDKICHQGAQAAERKGMERAQIVTAALAPVGGASEVGASICRYAEQQKVDVVVVGSRGMSALKRSFMSFIGLGSVSDYCVHNLRCAVAIVKGPKHAGHAEQAAAAAGDDAAAGGAASGAEGHAADVPAAAGEVVEPAAKTLHTE